MRFSFKVKLLTVSIFATMLAFTSALAVTTGVTSASSLNLRQEPNTDASIISKIPNGSNIAIEYIHENGWAKVSYDGVTGFASAEYITQTADADFAIGKGLVITESGSLNMRNAPVTGSVVTKISKGAVVDVIGIQDGWFKVSYNGNTGFVSPEYIDISKATETSRSTASTSATRANVIDYAERFLGVPYVYGGSTPSGFDCSGFTSYVMKNFGISMPRTSSSQYSSLTKISKSELLPGDLVFFGGSRVNHVGIYAGNGQMIHSPSPGKSVEYVTIESGYYLNNYIGSARVIFD